MTAPQHPFIDMHTHLFTARYLPLQGVFMGFTKGHLPRLCRGLAKVINRITAESDFGAPQESEALQEELAEAILTRDADAMMRLVSQPMREVLSAIPDGRFALAERSASEQEMVSALDDLMADLRDNPSGDTGPDGLRELGIARPSADSLFSNPALPPEELDELIRDAFVALGEALEEADFLHSVAHLHLDGPFAEGSDRGLEALSLDGSQLGSLRQTLLFIVVMAMSERTRFSLLERDYAKGKPDDGHDAEHYVGVLMDMQGPYDSYFADQDLLPPAVLFDAQVRRMSALSAETGGQLISFSAVDPFRPNWKDYVTQAVQDGAQGFKLYCPLGVRPIDGTGTVTPVTSGRSWRIWWKNRHYRRAADRTVPDQTAQGRMGAILKHFADNGLRMYTHCTPIGFQVETGYGIFGDPQLWGEAMEAHGAQDLWLFLGHAGGATHVDGGGWAIPEDPFDDPDATFFAQTFAGRAIRLAEQAQNVYLGSAFFEVLDHDEHGHDQLNLIQRRMKRILTNARRGARQHVSTRLCFGTDWSMPMAIGRTRELLNSYYAFFNDDDLRGFAPLFFRENARRYLGLSDVG